MPQLLVQYNTLQYVSFKRRIIHFGTYCNGVMLSHCRIEQCVFCSLRAVLSFVIIYFLVCIELFATGTKLLVHFAWVVD